VVVAIAVVWTIGRKIGAEPERGVRDIFLAVATREVTELRRGALVVIITCLTCTRLPRTDLTIRAIIEVLTLGDALELLTGVRARRVVQERVAVVIGDAATQANEVLVLGACGEEAPIVITELADRAIIIAAAAWTAAVALALADLADVADLAVLIPHTRGLDDAGLLGGVTDVVIAVILEVREDRALALVLTATRRDTARHVGGLVAHLDDVLAPCREAASVLAPVGGAVTDLVLTVAVFATARATLVGEVVTDGALCAVIIALTCGLGADLTRAVLIKAAIRIDLARARRRIAADVIDTELIASAIIVRGALVGWRVVFIGGLRTTDREQKQRRHQAERKHAQGLLHHGSFLDVSSHSPGRTREHIHPSRRGEAFFRGL
jgi:hypothetical protein